MKILLLAIILVFGASLVIASHNIFADNSGTNLDYGKYPVTIPIDSPLMQYRLGIQAEDVKCKEGLDLILKSKSGEPVCLKPQTAQKLVERGWGTIPNGIQNTDISYQTSLIKKLVILPGPVPAPILACSTLSDSADASIISSLGFKEILHKSQQGFNGDNYVLLPGSSGSITIKIRVAHAYSLPSSLSRTDITKTELFVHQAKLPQDKFTHPGLAISYAPDNPFLRSSTSITRTLVISASPDAPLGTYWLFLQPGGCSGGPLILFTVGNEPY